MDLEAAVRLEIGDTDEQNGILPGRRQYTAEEITYAASTEKVTETADPSPRDVGRTSARLLEIAATSWASQPEEVELGPSMEKGRMSVLLSRQASILRAIWGTGDTSRTEGPKKAPSYTGVGLNVLPPGIG